jgi:hypothetical protein
VNEAWKIDYGPGWIRGAMIYTWSSRYQWMEDWRFFARTLRHTSALKFGSPYTANVSQTALSYENNWCLSHWIYSGCSRLNVADHISRSLLQPRRLNVCHCPELSSHGHNVSSQSVSKLQFYLRIIHFSAYHFPIIQKSMMSLVASSPDPISYDVTNNLTSVKRLSHDTREEGFLC